jgi:hypothetical protein
MRVFRVADSPPPVGKLLRTVALPDMQPGTRCRTRVSTDASALVSTDERPLMTPLAERRSVARTAAP